MSFKALSRIVMMVLLLLLVVWVGSNSQFLASLEAVWQAMSHLLAVLCLLGVGAGLLAAVLFVVYVLRL